MIAFEKQTLNCGKSVFVEYDGFAIGSSEKKNVLVGTESKNCACVGGKLKTGVGIKPFLQSNGKTATMSGLIVPAWFFLFTKEGEDGSFSTSVGCVTDSSDVYMSNQDGLLIKKCTGWGRMRPLEVVNEFKKQLTVFAGDVGVFVYDGETTLGNSNASKASEIACWFEGRTFFALAPYTIAYSAPYKPFDFNETIDEGGRICFPAEAGKIVALVPMGEYLYVFYERGISRLAARGKARDFCVEKLEYGGGNIFGNTVGVCSVGKEKAFFLAEDGLYAFDGKTCSPVCRNLKVKPLRGTHVCGYGVFEGGYFTTFMDENRVKRGVVIDAETEEGYDAFFVETLSVCNRQTLCYSSRKAQLLTCDGDLPIGETYRFNAEGVRFGLRGRKTLKRLSFRGIGVATVMVKCGNRTLKRTLTFTDGVAVAELGIRGEAFEIALLLEKGTTIEAMTAELSTL